MSVKAAQLRRELEQNKHRCETGMFVDNQKITVIAADLERLIIEAEALEQLQQQNRELVARVARLSDMRHHVTPTVINGKAEYVHVSEISKYINKVNSDE